MRLRLLVALLLALPLQAAELAIVGGGARVVDVDPASAGDNCSGVTYSPSLAGDAMYVVHDRLVNHCKFDMMSPGRFGDRIARATRIGGAWTAPEVVLDRGSLPWMNDETYLRAHPEATVGHLASPSVRKIGDRWVMAFTASINDPNLCAGEHPAAGTPCGSCRDPWSYFVAMWAVSDDGIHWRVRAPEAGRANRALDAALLWRTPSAAEGTAPSQFKGLTRVSIMEHEEGGRTWIYFLSHFWNRQFIRSVAFRMAWDDASEWGITGDPEMLTFRGWEAMPGGRIPLTIDDNSTAPSTFFFTAGTVARQTRLPGGRYIAFGSADSYDGLAVRPASVLVWSTSDNLVNWTFGGYVRSTLPYVGDGTGYSASVIDPTYYEDVDGPHLLVASADGDEAAGIARDGKHDCAVAADAANPTAPYIGTGIYDYNLGERERIVTSTTMEAPKSAAAGGTVRVRITVRAADGSAPHGTLKLYAGNIMELPLVDGVAEADVVMPERTMQFSAAFNSNGVYLFSGAVAVVEAVPVTRRRAARR